MEGFWFDAPSWLAGAAGDARPAVIVLAAVAALADHWVLRRRPTRR